MRKILFVLACFFLVGGVSAQVDYSIVADEDEVLKNTTVILECDGPCPGLSWTVSDEEVLAVEDGQGEVDYEKSGESLEVPPSGFTGRDNRTVRIMTRIDEPAEEVTEGLYRRIFELSGLEGENTIGELQVEGMVSAGLNHGFEQSFEDDVVVFKGEGPPNVWVNFGEGLETDYFTFFGEDVEADVDVDTAYEIAVGTTGLVQGFETLPVVVYEEDVYEREVSSSSSGQYSRGVIKIRNSEALEDSFVPILAHEVVHGLNHREFSWDNTETNYLDEGLATYTEFLTGKKLFGEEVVDQPPRELFGDEVTYNTDSGRFSIPSRGDREELWEYYQDDQDFMKTWHSTQSDHDSSGFAYAYSQLIIRNYVSRMDGSVEEFYSELDVEEEVSDPGEKWGIYSEYLEMRPCDYGSREEFDACIDEINDYDYPVYSAEPERTGGDLEIERVEVPERKVSASLGSVWDREISLLDYVKIHFSSFGFFIHDLVY